MTGDSGSATGQRTAWQMLTPVIDLVTPMAVRAAATLRLADLMPAGPVAVTELARKSGTDPDALRRLLRHLVGHGVFLELSPGEFAVNELAALLRSDHPSGMRVSLDLDGFGGQMDLAFTGLLHSLRTGGPAWEKVFGAPFWEYLAAHPTMKASFDETMAAGAEYVADDVAAYEWPKHGHVVDVGGGDGALLTAVLRARPDLRGTLVDLPDTASRARQRIAAEGLEARCAAVGQSFFDPLPIGGDVYVLNSVLHDWPDRDAMAILRRCVEAAGDGGRIVIIEEDAIDDEQPDFTEMNLRMLVLCGGRERTLDDYEALAAEAGLLVTEVHSTPLGQASIELSRRGGISRRGGSGVTT